MGTVDTKKRNITADVLKGIMIFCVMYGHSISLINQIRGVTWHDSVVNVFFTVFEMPLFILLSGYFLWFSLRKKTHFRVLFNRIVAITLPLLVWEWIPDFFVFIKTMITNGFSSTNLKGFIVGLGFPRLWFLACYLVCTVFVIFVDWLLSRIKNRAIKNICAVISYAALVVGLHFINLQLNHIPFMFPFFLIGFFISKYDLLNKKWARIIIYLLSGLFFILYPFYKPENSFYDLVSYVLDSTSTVMPIIIHRFVLSLAGCCLFYVIAAFVCKKAANSKLVLLIANLGGKTLELYVLSMTIQTILAKIAEVLIKDVSIITDVTAPLVFGPIFLIVLITICLLINLLVQRFPMAHKILFGR